MWEGKKLDNGFKKVVWQEIMEEFNKGAFEEEKTILQLKPETRINIVSFLFFLLLILI